MGVIMSIPLLCHVFLILFGGFFAIMFGFVLMLIATLPMLQIGGFSSAKELVAGVGIFTLSAFIFNMGLVLKVWSTFDGADHEPKNAIRPLIPLIAVIIYFVTS
jgi:hypothetical protein